MQRRYWPGHTHDLHEALRNLDGAFLADCPSTNELEVRTPAMSSAVRVASARSGGRCRDAGSAAAAESSTIGWRRKITSICSPFNAKGVKDDLTAAERDAWRKAVEAINND